MKTYVHALAALFAASSTVACANPTPPKVPEVPGAAEESEQPRVEPTLSDGEEVLRVPVEGGVFSKLTLETTLFRPNGQGQYPLVIMNHGSPRKAAGRKKPRWRPVAQAKWFVDHGFVVAVPMRRGYATSGGDWAEDYGGCKEANYYDAGLESAKDILGVQAWLAKDPHVDPKRFLLVGWSAGGFGAIAAGSQRPAGLMGILNFAGGRGSNGPDDVCSPDHLVDAYSRYGDGTAVPSLWLYSENDHFFGPSLAKQLFDAYDRGRNKARFVQLPAFGNDGHAVFNKEDAMALWTSTVEKFLTEIHAK